MASPPKFTDNSDAPLSAEELAGDRAASSQTTDPLDAPDFPDDGPASESGMAGDHGDTAHDIEADITLLPPG